MGRTKPFNKRRKNKSISNLILKVSIPFKNIQRLPISSIRKSLLPQPSPSSFTHRSSLPDGWTILPPQSNDDTNDTIHLCHMGLVNDKCAINHTLTLLPDHSYTLALFSHDVNIGSQQLPHKLHTKEELIHTLNATESMKICPGNPDPDFLELAHLRKGKMCDIRNYSECYMQLKQFKAPYRLAKDLRLEV